MASSLHTAGIASTGEGSARAGSDTGMAEPETWTAPSKKRGHSKYNQKLKSRRASCQVEGCANDVPTKAYHQRYRICAPHASAPHMVLDGHHVRFCQHHGRFHPVAEFDGSYRSCRASLARHRTSQARRLKKKSATRHPVSLDGEIFGEDYGEDGGSIEGGPPGRGTRARCAAGSHGVGGSSGATLTADSARGLATLPGADHELLPLAPPPAPLPAVGAEPLDTGLLEKLFGAAADAGGGPEADLLSLERLLGDFLPGSQTVLSTDLVVPGIDDMEATHRVEDLNTNTDSLSGPSLEAMAPKASAGPRKRQYKPRTGVTRLKNMDTQRRYRERRKECAAAAAAALATTAAELQAAKVEQVALQEQNRALDLLRHYSECALSLLRSAASAAAALPAAAASAALCIYRDVIDYLWSYDLRPSDFQLRLLARHLDLLPPVLNAAYIGRVVDSFEKWHRSPPAGRQAVENKLTRVFETRFRVMTMVFTEFPDKARFVARIGTITPDLREAIENAASLRSPDVLQAVELTEEQVSALRGHWEAYVERYRAAKGLLANAVGRVEASLGAPGEDTPSMRDAVLLQAESLTGCSAAAAFLAEERAARLELTSAAHAMLSPLQIAWIHIMALRVLPAPNLVDIFRDMLFLRDTMPSPNELLALADAGASP